MFGSVASQSPNTHSTNRALSGVAAEESHLVIGDADSVRSRVRYVPCRAGIEAEPLIPGNGLIVNHVNPVDGLTTVERLTQWVGEMAHKTSCLFIYWPPHHCHHCPDHCSGPGRRGGCP
jgi:hypothetical protein